MKRSAIKRGNGFKARKARAHDGESRRPSLSKRSAKKLREAGEKKRKTSTLREKPYHSITTKRGLKDALDAEVSLTVRESNPACVLCGESDWQKLTCGHLFKRTYEPTRFDTHEGGNCSTLCKSCNDRDNRDHDIYVDWFKGRYGVAAYEALEARARSGRQFETFELRGMLDSLRENNTRKKAA